MKKLFYSLSLLVLWLFFSSWGSTAHRIINTHAPASFPYVLNFLKSTWPAILGEHASDADYRKDTDPNEAPKHYIDIENYSEFMLEGKIPMSYDSAVMLHGSSFVISNGTLPWTTVITVDSLKNCFERHDFTKASLVAADLGHYIGDGHQPLHITTNYDGQMTGQDGVHARYETSMINRYEDQLNYPDDSASFIEDVPSYIFTYIYLDHKYVDSVLLADTHASQAGNIGSTAYYTDFWNQSGNFTIGLLKNASFDLAGLIYTAWIEAGSPLPWPEGIEEKGLTSTRIIQNYPNPFTVSTTVPLEVTRNNTFISVKVMDAVGNVKATLLDEKKQAGLYDLTWDATGVPGGIYYVVMNADDQTETLKMILIR